MSLQQRRSDSYSDRAILFTLSLPQIPAPSDNPFDGRAKKTRASALANVSRLKQQAADHLRGLPAAAEEGTDVWGFLAKAAELFASAPADRRHRLVIASDLGDTEGKRVELRLESVDVTVLAYQSGSDPQAAAKRKGFWRGVLEDAGATVRFLDPSLNALEALR